MHDVSNRGNHLYSPHNNSSVYLITTYVRRTGRITNGMRSGRTDLRYKIPHFHPRHRHPHPRNDPPKNSLGSTKPPPHWYRTFPLLHVQMGYGFFCGLWVWSRGTNRRPCCPPMSNPSTSSWTARSDGSGRWDNRMAAQHLPRDLVRPSSGLKNSLKRRRKCTTHWYISTCPMTPPPPRLISNFLISTQIFLCTKMISNYPCS